MHRRKIGRDARTGQFVSVREARRHPSTTTVETVENPRRRFTRRRAVRHVTKKH
jgi:hypothetical protein